MLRRDKFCYYFPWMVYLSSNAPILSFSSIYFLHRLPLLGRWKTQRWQCSGPWSTSLQAACECSYNLLHPNAFSLNILRHHKINQLAMFCQLKFWYTTYLPSSCDQHWSSVTYLVFGPSYINYTLLPLNEISEGLHFLKCKVIVNRYYSLIIKEKARLFIFLASFLVHSSILMKRKICMISFFLNEYQQ